MAKSAKPLWQALSWWHQEALALSADSKTAFWIRKSAKRNNKMGKSSSCFSLLWQVLSSLPQANHRLWQNTHTRIFTLLWWQQHDGVPPKAFEVHCVACFLLSPPELFCVDDGWAGAGGFAVIFQFSAPFLTEEKTRVAHGSITPSWHAAPFVSKMKPSSLLLLLDTYRSIPSIHVLRWNGFGDRFACIWRHFVGNVANDVSLLFVLFALQECLILVQHHHSYVERHWVVALRSLLCRIALRIQVRRIREKLPCFMFLLPMSSSSLLALLEQGAHCLILSFVSAHCAVCVCLKFIPCGCCVVFRLRSAGECLTLQVPTGNATAIPSLASGPLPTIWFVSRYHIHSVSDMSFFLFL